MPTKPPTYASLRRTTKRPKDNRPSPSKRGYGRSWQRKRWHIYTRDGGMCQKCNRLLGKKGEWHVDHITARNSGGSDHESNLQLLCASCHSRKTATEDGGFGIIKK